MLGDIEIGFLRTHSILASLAQTVPHKLVPFNHQPYQSAYQTCLPLNKWTSQPEIVQTYQAINTVPPLFFQSLAFRLCLESQSCALFLPPAWYKKNWINCLFFYVWLWYIAWKRGPPQKFAHFVLFCPIKKHSFNRLCILDVFGVFRNRHYLAVSIQIKSVASHCRLPRGQKHVEYAMIDGLSGAGIACW